MILELIVWRIPGELHLLHDLTDKHLEKNPMKLRRLKNGGFKKSARNAGLASVGLRTLERKNGGIAWNLPDVTANLSDQFLEKNEGVVQLPSHICVGKLRRIRVTNGLGYQQTSHLTGL